MNIYDRIKNGITQKFYQEKFSNDGQRFVAWYLRNIYELDEFETENCITDGANDKKIDAVYINHQDETIYIIQGKFYNQKGRVDSGPLMEILGAWLNIRDLRYIQENGNAKLSSKINEISSALDDDYETCFELVTTAELSKTVRRDLESFVQAMTGSKAMKNDKVMSTNIVLVDAHTLEVRFNDAMNMKRPCIDYTFRLEEGRYIYTTINGTKTVTAVLNIRDCVNIPGIQDGSIFRKNVRQSLGKGVKVNRAIAMTLRNFPGEFFFLNNGITAICSSVEIDKEKSIMRVKDISVVNGCQSLTSMYNNSEALKITYEEGYVLFRLYEINNNARMDMISTSTNSQNTVKARDLRSNDSYVLEMKKEYEHLFPDGQFITKRGEKPGTGKNKMHIIDLSQLCKSLMSWHAQRPSETHSESKIFRDHFEKLFHRDYSPQKIQALNEIFSAIKETWTPSNPNYINFKQPLLIHRAHGIYLHMFSVSALISMLNDKPENMVPDPYAAVKITKGNGTFDELIRIAGNCVNTAFIESRFEAKRENKVFEAVRWPKSAHSMIAIRLAIEKFSTLEEIEHIAELRAKMKMSDDDFELVWA